MDKILTIIILLFPVFKFFSKEVVKHRKNFKNDDPYDSVGDKMGRTFKSIKLDMMEELKKSSDSSDKESNWKKKKSKKNKFDNVNYQKKNEKINSKEKNIISNREKQNSIENLANVINKIKEEKIENNDVKGKEESIFEMTEDSLINGIILKEILDKPLAFRE